MRMGAETSKWPATGSAKVKVKVKVEARTCCNLRNPGDEGRRCYPHRSQVAGRRLPAYHSQRPTSRRGAILGRVDGNQSLGRDVIRCASEFVGPSEGLKVPLRGSRGTPTPKLSCRALRPNPGSREGRARQGETPQSTTSWVEMTRSEAQESPREHGQVLHNTKIRALIMMHRYVCTPG